MTGRRTFRSGIGRRFWYRQIRHEAAVAVAVALTTLLAVTAVSLAPRVLEHASVVDVRSALASATPEERNIQFQYDGRVGAPSQEEPFGLLDVRGDALLDDELPESVAGLVTDQRWVYDSPMFTVRSFPEMVGGPFPTTFRFRYQSGLDEQLTVVRGRLPERATELETLVGPECPSDGTAPEEFEPTMDQQCEVFRLPVFETAVTQQTATDMSVDVGDDVTLTPNRTDLAWRAAPAGALDAVLVLRISGIVELTDPTDEYWFSDTSLHRPRITESADYRLVGAVGLIVPEQYRQFLQEVPSVAHRYTWRYVIDPGLVTSADAGRLATDVERVDPEGYVTSTLLPDVLAEHVAQRRLTVQLLSTSTSGMFAVAIAAVVVLGALGAVRRRVSTVLLIDRGASRWQLGASSACSAVFTVVLPTLLGALIAWRCLPATGSAASVRSALALGACAFVAVVASSLPGGSAGQPADRARPGPDDDARRLVVEVSIVVVAIGSLLLLRRRAPVDARVDGGLDLLLAVAPVLLALTAGLAGVRLVGPVARAGAALGRRRRTLAPFVGFRRLVVQPPSSRTPVAVMTIAVATAVLASVLATSLAAGQVASSWQVVGGDHRVETFVDDVPLPVSLDADTFGGMTVVFGARLPGQRVEVGDRAPTVDLVGIDAAGYRSMLEGSGVPETGLEELVAASAGPDRLPAIAVGRWPTPTELAVADEAVVKVGAFAPVIEVAAVVDRFPGLSPGRPTLVTDLDALRRVTDDRIAQPSFALLDGEPGAGEEIARIVDEQGALAILTSRNDRLDAIAGDPFSTWTLRSLWAVIAVSIVFIVVAVVSAAVIAAASRRRDLALLRVLGLRPRGARAVIAIEHVPAVVTSIVVGVLMGIVTAVLLEPVIGVSAFAGGGPGVATRVDGSAIVWLVATIGVASALGIAAAHRVTGRAEDARMLRIGDQ